MFTEKEIKDIFKSFNLLEKEDREKFLYKNISKRKSEKVTVFTIGSNNTKEKNK